MFYLLVLLLLLVFVVQPWKLKRLIKFSRQIKCGIKSYSFMGYSFLLSRSGVNRMNAIKKLAREAIKNGGHSGMWLGAKYYVNVVDPVDLELILKTALEKDNNVIRFARKLTGNGTIFAPVSIWRHRRKILAPTFSLKQLNKYVEVFSRQSRIMVEQMTPLAEHKTTSVWKYITSYTLDAVCETALNVELNSQLSPEAPFIKSFEECSKLVASRMVQPWLHSDVIYNLLPYYRNFVKCKKIIWAFIDEAIRCCRQNMINNKEDWKDKIKSFLELMIESSGTERAYSDQELREETLVIVLAGNDTSAVGLCFVLSMLAKYPDIQEKVYEELQAVFGNSNRPLTADDLPRLKYLETVIKETLRLYPPVPVIVRHIDKDLLLPSGITLVAGCAVIINIWGTQRHPLYWGDTAEQFCPERFQLPLKHPVAYLVFSHGPRGCLGYQYAMNSMKTALAAILRRYHISSEDDGNNTGNIDKKCMKLSFDIMMKDVDGCKVKLKNRTKCTLD